MYTTARAPCAISIGTVFSCVYTTSMDDLLTTDDFEDIAAAIGEGGDASDDDARVREGGERQPCLHM